jgi:hypothetical protein
MGRLKATPTPTQTNQFVHKHVQFLVSKLQPNIVTIVNGQSTK